MSQIELILGLDIGTSSVKSCLLNSLSGEATEPLWIPTEAKVESDHPKGDCQDPVKILQAVEFCLNKYDPNLLKMVGHIAVCGQMHGVVLWASTSISDKLTPLSCSNLYTWQDQRCSPEFLASLPSSNHSKSICTGYGCATLLWLTKFKPDLINGYDKAGTIMDLLTATLTQGQDSFISTQNATSWGYFSSQTYSWEEDLLEIQGLNLNLLPKVKYIGSQIGIVPSDHHFTHLRGARVYVASGDMQCAVIASLQGSGKSSAVLNLNTSAQLAFLSDADVPSLCIKHSSVGIEEVPFFDQMLHVFPCLNGGNCLDTFVDSLFCLMKQFDLDVSKSQLWKKILDIETAAASNPEEELLVDTRLLGERYAPDLKGSVSNISGKNLKLENMVHGICQGIIRNISRTVPQQLLESCGINKLIAVGKCLKLHPALQAAVKMEFSDLDIVFAEEGHSCIGAAEFVRIGLKEIYCQ